MSKEHSEQTIQKLIEQMEITQAQLAYKLGVSQNTVNAWFNGHKIPRADNFLALCRELGLSPKALATYLKWDVTGVPNDQTPEQ